MSNLAEEFDLIKVIEHNYCIGCGTCTAVEESPIQIRKDANGQYQAFVPAHYIDEEIKYRLNTVCPFTNSSDNEDIISKNLFNNIDGYHKKIGAYNRLYAGYVSEGNYRDTGSSGGFGSWICIELLKNNLVDEIVHIKGDQENKFMYSISSTEEEVLSGAKSRYYPIEMSGVLNYINNSNKTFAIVGIPCFIKSIRLLTLQNELYRSKVKFAIGLVCGHLKSSFYADMLAWKLGVHPDKSYDINFREKIKGRKANDYGTKVTHANDNGTSQVTKLNSTIYGTNWGYGFFKYNACDYCDDVLAETADVTIGDAWLPEYIDDYRGANIIISRNPVIKKLLSNACSEKRIVLDSLTEDKIIDSQAGGFRHRHEGLSYRLYLMDKKNKWRPQKRIKAGKQHLSIIARFNYWMRIKIRKSSFNYFKIALRRNNLNYFDRRMKTITTVHEFITKNSLFKFIKKLRP